MKTRRIPALDGIRGLAILLVLGLHSQANFADVPVGSTLARLFALTRLWWCGVDLFFVLSGFLIGGILLNARDSSSYYRTFYMRRAFRILPLYFLLLSLYSLVSQWLPPFGDPIPFALYPLMLQNFVTAATGFFGVVWLSVTWSLAVEEHFYLIAPTLIRRLSDRTMISFVVAAIIVTPVIRVIMCLAWPTGFMGAYVLVISRADALMWGIGIALIMRNAAAIAWLEQRRKWLLAGLAIAAAFVGYMTMENWTIVMIAMNALGYSVIAGGFALLVLLVLINDDSRLAALFRWRPLRFLGVRAYAIYLFHLPAIYLVFLANGYTSPAVRRWDEWALAWLGIAAAVLFASFTWKFIELPLIARSHRFNYEREKASEVVTRAA